MELEGLLGDMPIRHKLRAIILIISGIAVLGACTVFLSRQWASSRDALARGLAITAEIVADQSTAAVEFALRAERQIMIAALYTGDGQLLARYLRDGIDPGSVPGSPGPDGRALLDGDLIVIQPLLSDGARVGTLLLRSDMAEARRRLGAREGSAG
jgi:hypothetical protein